MPNYLPCTTCTESPREHEFDTYIMYKGCVFCRQCVAAIIKLGVEAFVEQDT